MADHNSGEIDPSNAEQAHSWNGEDGSRWARNAERFEQALAGYDGPLLNACQLTTTSRVLDIGCGTGSTTRTAARHAGAGTVLGVDLSEQLIQVAQRRAHHEGLTNVAFVHADAQVHAFSPASFDVCLSRTGAMFFGDPSAAFRNLASAVRPGGRLALLVWQDIVCNEWMLAIMATLAPGRPVPTPPVLTPGPFSMRDPDPVTALLEAAGFSRVRWRGLHAPMRFGDQADDACDFIAELFGWMLDGSDQTARARALGELRALVESSETNLGVFFDSATWLITTDRP